MTSGLWRILLKIQERPADIDLTCDECFTLLEYLISQVSQETYLDSLYKAARTHWRYCPKCREHHLQKLKNLEVSYLSQQSENSTNSLDSFLSCTWPPERTNDNPSDQSPR